jgi:hypothetical protein
MMERYNVRNYRYAGRHRTADYHGRLSLVRLVSRIAVTAVIALHLMMG